MGRKCEFYGCRSQKSPVFQIQVDTGGALIAFSHVPSRINISMNISQPGDLMGDLKAHRSLGGWRAPSNAGSDGPKLLGPLPSAQDLAIC